MKILMSAKPVLIAILVLISAGIGYGVYRYLDSQNPPVSDNGINYGPPTEAELDETQRHKESLTENGEQNENVAPVADGQKQSVTPIISYWGQVGGNSDLEVNGYVPNIVERGGECKATLIKGSESVSVAKSALDDAQSTSCGLMVVARNKLSAGDWQLVLSYESTKSKGSSEPVTVTIK